MAETIYLKEIRNQVDEKYVGFKPNGSSVKPVHIFSGVTRSIYGKTADTTGIRKFAFVSDTKGHTPVGNDLSSIKEFLKENDILEDDISDNGIRVFRDLSQKLLSADKAFYSEKDDGINSYSAMSKDFISTRAMYEDAGEFVGELIGYACPKLSNYIKSKLDDTSDATSILFSPINKLFSDKRTFSDDRVSDLPIMTMKSSAWDSFCEGIKLSGETLVSHFELQPNKYYVARIFNFFCIYVLVRYLSSLESFYCKTSMRPFVLDFSGDAASSIAKLSVMSYTQIHQSISRFYAWGYARLLDSMGFSKKDLLSMPTPLIDKSGKTKGGQDRNIPWDNAKIECSESMSDNEAQLIFGGAMYDILAMEASSHPIVYVRQIATSAGLLYPPTNMHPKKRFSVSQDMLEMIIRCCVGSSETLTSSELRNRLWERLGIIIGGGSTDLETLQQQGAIVYADSDALSQNFDNFAARLEQMSFATQMADGILQINLGGK